MSIGLILNLFHQLLAVVISFNSEATNSGQPSYLLLWHKETLAESVTSLGAGAHLINFRLHYAPEDEEHNAHHNCTKVHSIFWKLLFIVPSSDTACPKIGVHKQKTDDSKYKRNFSNREAHTSSLIVDNKECYIRILWMKIKNHSLLPYCITCKKLFNDLIAVKETGFHFLI